MTGFVRCWAPPPAPAPAPKPVVPPRARCISRYARTVVSTENVDMAKNSDRVATVLSDGALTCGAMSWSAGEVYVVVVVTVVPPVAALGADVVVVTAPPADGAVSMAAGTAARYWPSPATATRMTALKNNAPKIVENKANGKYEPNCRSTEEYVEVHHRNNVAWLYVPRSTPPFSSSSSSSDVGALLKFSECLANARNRELNSRTAWEAWFIIRENEEREA